MDNANIVLITLGILQLIATIIIPFFAKTNIKADRGSVVINGNNNGNVTTNNTATNSTDKKIKFPIIKILITTALIEFLIALWRYYHA